MMTLAGSFTAPKMALAVPGTKNGRCREVEDVSYNNGNAISHH